MAAGLLQEGWARLPWSVFCFSDASRLRTRRGGCSEIIPPTPSPGRCAVWPIRAAGQPLSRAHLQCASCLDTGSGTQRIRQMHEIGLALVSNLAKVVAVSALAVLATASALDPWLELRYFQPPGHTIKPRRL